jgi:uncharacterized membrane protein
VTAPSLTNLERHLGRILLSGVITSAVLLAAGLILWLLNPVTAHGDWLLNAGLIVLMATPIMRVVVSVAEFVQLRQWFFVAVTLLVLAELTITVAVALTR